VYSCAGRVLRGFEGFSGGWSQLISIFHKANIVPGQTAPNLINFAYTAQIIFVFCPLHFAIQILFSIRVVCVLCGFRSFLQITTPSHVSWSMRIPKPNWECLFMENSWRYFQIYRSQLFVRCPDSVGIVLFNWFSLIPIDRGLSKKKIARMLIQWFSCYEINYLLHFYSI